MKKHCYINVHYPSTPTSAMQLLIALSRVGSRFHFPEAATTALLQQLAQTTDALAPGISDYLPTDSSGLHSTLLQGYAPNLYRYCVCMECGRVRRKELKSTLLCQCGKQRWEKSKYIEVFCPIEWLQSIVNCRTLSDLLSHETRRSNDSNIHDCYDTEFWDITVTQDSVLGGDVRHLKLMAFMDGFRLNPSDTRSPSMKALVLYLLNWPPHLRHYFGFGFPMFVIDKKLPTLRYVL